MVQAIPTPPSKLLFTTTSLSITTLSPLHCPSRAAIPSFPGNSAPKFRCQAAGSTAVPEAQLKKKSRYNIENLTTWLLKQEQDGNIDTELTIVLSSISLACKQIGSLLQRSSIINLTGAQGTINIQGEDQKKLDVISNEVSLF